MGDNRRLTLKQVLDRRPSRSTSGHKDELRSRSFANAEKQPTSIASKIFAKTTLSKQSTMLPNFSSSLKTLYQMGANHAMAIGGGIASKFPQQPTEHSEHDATSGNGPRGDADENLDTQVMNIEADFEQLDIGEEPIFERNPIKRTSTNHLKDKMSHLQYSYATKTLKRQESEKPYGGGDTDLKTRHI